jgi:hypothetical protein
MGRNSVDATKASLMRCARAALTRRAAGLKALLLRREVFPALAGVLPVLLAGLPAALVAFPVVFPAVPVAFPAVLEGLCFEAEAFAFLLVCVAPEACGVGSSTFLPAAGIAIIKAQNNTAINRIGTGAEREN